MLTRNKNLVVLAVLTSGIALTAADSAPRSRADELHPSAAQGSTAQASAAQGAAAQGSSTQGSWDAVTLGRIEPRAGEIKIAAPLPGGRIAEVLVKPNDEVFAGELLVRLDDEEALARVAEAERIPIQHAAFQSYGSDAGALSKNGIPAALICYPTRYTHSPIETVREEDLEATSGLLRAFFERAPF